MLSRKLPHVRRALNPTLAKRTAGHAGGFLLILQFFLVAGGSHRYPQDSPYIRKGKSLSKVKIFIGAALVLAACAAGAIVFDLVRYADRPADEKGTPKVMVIRQGQSFNASLARLHGEGFITHPKKFKLFARYMGYDKKIKAGEYLLSATMSPRRILADMVSGKVRLYRLTVPEGYNLAEIANLVEKAGFAKSAEFLAAAKDPELLERLGLSASTFEGYLFPETYYFSGGATAFRIITVMVREFRKHFGEEWERRADELGFTVHEIVTLASIIEKETGAAIERPVISSVFHNRLKKRMRLETDPTVIYGIEDYNGNITRKHLRTPTPYNTYVIRGLPPGPIANPGEKALAAALYPDDTRYLYFVSKKDTTHQFSTNLKDHNRAVRKYQLRGRKKRK